MKTKFPQVVNDPFFCFQNYFLPHNNFVQVCPKWNLIMRILHERQYHFNLMDEKTIL